MKRRVKKIITIALLALSVSVFVLGCTDADMDTPTETPTEAPTEAPTEEPTEKPTEAPTEKPTEAPTEKPTEKPTEEPTEKPTEAPTEEPSTGIQAPVIGQDQLTQVNAVSNSSMYEELKKNYKVQLPVFKEGSTTSILEIGKNSEISFDNYYDKWFYYDPADQGLVFYTLVQGKKTANTTYTRTELREMMGDSTSDNWGWTGTHRMTTTECVTMIPQNGRVMVCQVHAIYPNGDNGPVPLKVIYEGNEKRLAVSFLTACDSTANQYYYFDDVELGQKFTTTMEFIAGSAYVTIESEGRTETYGYDLLENDPNWATYLNYFKAGNYIQDSSDPREGAGSVVRMYALDTYHDSDNANNKIYPIQELTLTQESVTLGVGERVRLQPTFAPVQTTNKELEWSVAGSGNEVVSVDQQGNIIAKKKGQAAVLACSKENPSKIAKCVVTVGDTIEKEPQLIYEQTFDKDNTAISLEELKASGVQISKDDLFSVVEGENPCLRFNDTDKGNSAKIAYSFAPVTGPVTVSMRVKVDANMIKGADTAKPSMSYSYFYTYGIDEPGDTPAVLGCMRNLGKRSGDTVINNAWGVTKGYLAAPLNTAQTQYEYGEWMELTMITTPADGSADSNTTTYYVNGYKVGSQLGNFNKKAMISMIDFAVGTKDMMDLSVDDLRIYDGEKVPQSDKTTAPSEIICEPIPAVMSVGDNHAIMAKAAPADAYDGLTYSVVSGDSITVSKDGFIIAAKAGESVVRISSSLYPEVYTEQRIQVLSDSDYVPVTGIIVEDDKGTVITDKISMKVKDTMKTVAKALPLDASNQAVNYVVVSGEEVVDVYEDGTIVAKRAGSASIKVVSVGSPEIEYTFDVIVLNVAAEGTLLFKDDFEQMLNTDIWTVESQNTGNTVNRIENGALIFQDNNASGQPRAYVTFSPTAGAVTFKFKLRIDDDKLLDNGKASSIRISVGAGQITKTANEAFTLKNTATIENGVITKRAFQYSLPESGKFSNIRDYNLELGKWIDVAMVVRTNDGTDAANTTSLYIDGVKYADQAANKISYDTIDKICFGTGSGDLTKYAIDDLYIYQGDTMNQ